MTEQEIIDMARDAQMPYYYRTGEISNLENLNRFAELVAAKEREKLAAWMVQRGYATGHGDTTEELLAELEWQIQEQSK